METMNILVNAHIWEGHSVSAEMHELEGRGYMVVTVDGARAGVSLFINDKNKALEIADAIISAAEGWQEDQEKEA